MANKTDTDINDLLSTVESDPKFQVNQPVTVPTQNVYDNPEQAAIPATPSAPVPNPFNPGRLIAQPDAANLTGYNDADREARIQEANLRNNASFGTKLSGYADAGFEGGLIRSSQDAFSDTWKSWTAQDPTYNPSVEDIIKNSNFTISREEAHRIKDKAVNPLHEKELIGRIAEFNAAQQTISMADGYGTVYQFIGTTMDSLLTAVIPLGVVSRVGALGLGARVGAAVASNAGIAIGQEAFMSDVGMRKFDSGDALRAGALGAAFSIFDIKWGGNRSVRGAAGNVAERQAAETVGDAGSREMVQELTESSPRPATSNPAPTPTVNSLRNQVLEDGSTVSRYGNTNVSDILSGSTRALFTERLAQVRAEIRAEASKDSFSGNLAFASGIRALAREFGIPEHIDLDSALRAKTANVGAEQIQRQLVEDIRGTLGQSDLLDKDILTKQLEATPAAKAVEAEEAILDVAPKEPKPEALVAAPKELDGLTPFMEFEGRQWPLRYDNPLDRALHYLDMPGAEHLQGTLESFFAKNLPELTLDELQTMAKALREDHLPSHAIALPKGDIILAPRDAQIRIHDYVGEYERLNANRVAAREASKTDGLSYETATHGDDLAKIVEQDAPGIPVQKDPVIGIDEAGNPKGRWDARSSDKSAPEWKEATNTVRAAGNPDVKNLHAFYENHPVLKEHVDAVVAKLEGIPKVTGRLVKRLMSEEVYGKLTGTTAKVILVSVALTGTAQAQDGGLIAADAAQGLLAGALMGVGALRGRKAKSYSDTKVAQAVDGYPDKVHSEGSAKAEPQGKTPGETPQVKPAEKPVGQTSGSKPKGSKPAGSPVKVYTGSQGHLNHGVIDPSRFAAESIVMPDTKEIYLSKTDVVVPLVTRFEDVRVGFTVADYPGSSKSNTARAVTSHLMNTVAGRQGGTKTGERVATNHVTADVDKKSFMQRHLGTAIVDSEGHFMKWASANNIGWGKRRYGKDAAREFFDRVGMAYRGGRDDDPHVQAAVGVFRQSYRDAYDEAKAILDTLPDDLPPDSLLQTFRDIEFSDNYLPRIWDGRKLMELVATARDPMDLYRVFADAFQYDDGFRPPLEQRLKTAKDMVEFMIAVKNDPSIGNIAQMSATKIAEVGKTLGVSDDVLATYLSFGGVDATRFVSGRLQARIKINELADPVLVPTKDGGSMEIRVADMMVNDPRVLTGNWLNMTSGIYSMGIQAKLTGLDYTSEALWRQLIPKMVREGATEKEITMTKEVRNYLLGAGQTTTIMKEESQLGKTIRNVVLLKNSRDFIYATTGEMGYNKSLKVFGDNGILGYITNMIHLTKTGRIKGGLARDLQAATGVGLEGITPSLMNMVENNSIDTLDGLLGRAISDKFKLAGFTQLNAWQQGQVQQVALTRLVEHAFMEGGDTSLRRVTPAEWERFRSFGLDEPMLKDMSALIRKHAKVDAGKGLEGFDFKAMAKEDPIATSRLQGALFRFAKFATSDEAGVGEVVPFMTGDVGKTLFQFQAVTMRSLQKAKRSMLIRDIDEVQRISMSFTGAALGYIAKVNVLYANDPEELEKRLDEKEVFKAAFRNMALSGPLPAAIDMGGGILFGKTPFENSGNSDKTSRTSVAAIDTVNSLMDTTRNLVANVRDSENNVSQQELNNALKMTPMPHYMAGLISMGEDAMGIQKKDPVQRKADQ